jgi:hypothetical protein
MAITTYAELATAVGRFIGGSDDATAGTLGITSTIDDIITLGENRIAREVRTKDNESSFNVTIGASGTLSLPSDYIGIKYLRLDTSPTEFLEARPPQWIYSQYPERSSTGRPKYFAREAATLIFGPNPDSTYTVLGVYYKKNSALSGGAYALFTNNPDLFLFGCLAEAAVVIGPDSRIGAWEAKYQRILTDVNGMSAIAEYAGGPLRMRLS